MKTDTTPSIHSFIIRFVIEEASSQMEGKSGFHGAIRHIQNAEELNFSEWQEAVEFMRRFVPLDEPSDKSNRS